MDLSWTTLPLRGSFIPFINNVIHSIGTSQNDSIYAGDIWKYSLESKYLDSEIHYISPSGLKEIINTKTTNLFISETGIHSIFTGKHKITNIAVNIPTSELQSIILSKSDVKELFPNQIIFLNDNLTQEIRQARYGTEIWRYLLLLLILFTCIEMILSNGKRFQSR